MTVATPAPVAAPPVPRRARTKRLAGLRAVLERDFLVYTSRPRFLVLRTLAVLLPSVIILCVLWTTNEGTRMGSSGIGQVILVTSLVTLPALVVLLAPVLAASCIASERALNTLDIVLASPVSPFAFVAAKFLSRFGVVLVLVFATLPLAGICFLYGGVSAGLFIEMFALLVAVALLGTVSGIVASAFAKNVAAAALSSYFLALAVPLLHIVASVAYMAKTSTRWNGEAVMGLQANPFYAWGKLMEGGAGIGVTQGRPGLVLLGWTCVVAALGLALAGWRVGGEAGHKVAARGGERTSSPLRWANPVLDRELRGTLLHRPKAAVWWRFAFTLLLLGVAITIGAANSDLEDEWPHMIFLAGMLMFMTLAVTTTSSHSIASEREAGALDMLLATRLTPAEVIRGKYLGALLGMAPFVGISLVYGVIAATFSRLEFVNLAAWFLSAGVLILIAAALGVWCSTAASNAGRAVMRAYAILIGGGILHGVVSGVAVAFLQREIDDDAYWYIFGPNPGFIGGTLIGLSFDNSWRSGNYHGLISWTFWSCVYVGLAVWLLKNSAERLERRNEAS